MSHLSILKTGGQILVECLIKHSIDKAFCVPGESYLAVLDAFYDQKNKINLINAKHESGASNMAEAYGKLTGKPGIALVTRGPGACHASVGIHIAKQDSTPMILFVGQVANHFYGKESFQEIDYVSMFSKVAKWCFQIPNVESIEQLIHQAFKVSISGRQGPVVISLPEDILIKKTYQKDLKIHNTIIKKVSKKTILEIQSVLKESKKPMLILGGSSWSDDSRKNIETFAIQNHLPVVTSFRRQDIIDNRCENFVGALGTSVDPKLLDSFKEVDTVFALGARLSDMTTDSYKLFNSSAGSTKLIHIYPDKKEINRVFPSELSIQANINQFVEQLSSYSWFNGKKWGNWLKKLRKEYIKDISLSGKLQDRDLVIICKKISESINHNKIITLDAGNHTGWAQRYIQYHSKCKQIGSTCGSMGYSIPAAISSSLVFPEKKIISFVGDGGFLMSGLEISTAIQYQLNIIIIIINNSSYGTIRMHQEKHYPNRVVGTNIKNPDFVSLSKSMGADAAKVNNAKDFFIVFEKFLKTKKVSVIELITNIENISSRLILSKMQNK